MVALSKVLVCRRSPTVIARSNLTGGMDVSFKCFMSSGRDFCNEVITRPEESYRRWCVVVCDLETTKILVDEEEALAH